MPSIHYYGKDHVTKARNGCLDLLLVGNGDGYLVFQATRGSGYLGDIAIDDVIFREGACPQQGR